MSHAAKAQEPSMEEILASIRRIIADDEPGGQKLVGAPNPPVPPPVATAPSQAPPPAPPPAANDQEDIDVMLADLDAPPRPAPKQAAPSPDVLDLTEATTAPTPPPGPPPPFRTIDSASGVVFTESAPRSVPPPSASETALISRATISAVDSAFNSLANVVLGPNARTLEDLVKEMLRPMLKGWLDDNLPGMVERIVRAEIERVSRGRP